MTISERSTIRQLLLGIPVQEDVNLSHYTTLRVGGNAQLFVSPSTEEELVTCVSIARSTNTPYFILGNGSNLLISDEGFDGLVIHISRMFSTLTFEGANITAQAGCKLTTLSIDAAKRGLSGLEFASGIPGTIGGAVTMNAGAYGGDMSQVVREVRCIDQHGAVLTIPAAQMDFSYRNSRAKSEKFIILSASITLTPGHLEEISQRIKDIQTMRKEKQPLNQPNAGSFFKRPKDGYASALIEQAGLKGKTIGGACVSPLHSGFLVNIGHAKAADFYHLMCLIQDEVYKRFSVHLENEVCLIGEFNHEFFF